MPVAPPRPHAMMMLIPEAWGTPPTRMAGRKAAGSTSTMRRSWNRGDGPRPGRRIYRTGGRSEPCKIGNGLPARAGGSSTEDDLVVLASEGGARFRSPRTAFAEKGRVRPGQLFVVNTTQGRILHDEEIKERGWRRFVRIDAGVAEQPRRLFRRSSKAETRWRSSTGAAPRGNAARGGRFQRMFGYTREELATVATAQWHRRAEEPLGSMGNDRLVGRCSPTSRKLLFAYFRQLFAQGHQSADRPDFASNSSMSLADHGFGPQGNLLDETPEHAHRIPIRIHPCC